MSYSESEKEKILEKYTSAIDFDAEKVVIERHEAALDVLRKHDENGMPFILYLRKYDIHIRHGKSEPLNDFIEEQVQKKLPKGIGLLTVQEELLGEINRSIYNRSIPALKLEDNWKAILKLIIDKAELIISEIYFLSEGARWELETCRELGKHHQTVLILPPMQSYFKCIDGLNPLDQFARVVWADQLHTESLLENFVVNDLFKRVKKIAKLPKSSRKKIYAKQKVKSKFPISYKKVLTGYKKRAVSWEIEMSFASDNHDSLSYYRFWDWFHIASVLGVLNIEEKALTVEEILHDLAKAYIEILQGIAYGVVPLDEDNSFITRDYAINLVNALDKIIEAIPEGSEKFWLTRMSERTFKRLGIIS